MRNHTHIEAERIDQMHELARWDRQGHPLNANAAMAYAYEALSRLRARQPDPADLNQALQGLAKFGALTDVEGLEQQINRLIDDRAAIRQQRDAAWDRIEELESIVDLMWDCCKHFLRSNQVFLDAKGRKFNIYNYLDNSIKRLFRSQNTSEDKKNKCPWCGDLCDGDLCSHCIQEIENSNV